MTAWLAAGLALAGALAILAWRQRRQRRRDADDRHRFEASRHKIIEMIAESAPFDQILAALTALADSLAQDWRTIFLVLCQGKSRLFGSAAEAEPGCELSKAAGAGDESARAAFTGAGAAGNPACLRCRQGAGGEGRSRCWTQPLVSGAGEWLGLHLVLAAEAVTFTSNQASRLRAIGRLAALATEQRNLVDDLSFQAKHDALTGLFNRIEFRDRLRRAARAPHTSHGGGLLGLLSIGLDRFRLISDVLGQRVGDAVLQEVAWRLGKCVGQNGELARAGGDEFSALLPALTAQSEAEAVAEKMLESLGTPLEVEGHQLFLGASIGISCAPLEEADPDRLERNAFQALYHAKQSGKGRHMSFEPSMVALSPERLEMEKHLRRALKRHEMRMYYQPQIDFATRRMAGVEALLRWNHPELGLVSPGAFIPLAEETGLILALGSWVLGAACRQAQAWARAGCPLRVGVNVSVLEFIQPEFVSRVEDALTRSGLDPGRLELELTESLLMRDLAQASRVTERLRRLGVSLALNDFGTGYSSLAYLRELPFRRIKIGRSFVLPIRHAADSLPLVESMIRMAHDLGMTAIAEGIETPAQEDLLRRLGCDEGQGFLYSWALPAPELMAWLEQRRAECVAAEP